MFATEHFAFISRMIVRNDRTLLPIIPLLMIVGSWMFFEVNQVIRRLINKSGTTPQKKIVMISTLFLISLCLLLVQPLSKVYKNIIDLLTPNSRETARIWIEQNLPEGSKLAIESYSPFVNPEKFIVQGVGQMIDHDLNWYYEQGFEYLIFSQGMYGRYFAEPQKYNEQAKKYQDLFEKLTLIKIFNDGNYEVRIYKIQR